MVELSEEKEVRAAKPHRCTCCGDVIPAGEVYIRRTHKVEGVWYRFRFHVRGCSVYEPDFVD